MITKKILDSHHAVLIEGDREQSILDFRNVLKESGISVDANPDVTFLHFDSMGIAQAKSLVDLSLRAPVKEEYKIIVISIGSITREAENALLKLFEDPSPRVRFVIIVSNALALIATLRSRLFVLSTSHDLEDSKAKKFLKGSILERTQIIESLVKDQKESSSKEEIRNFLVAIHGILLEKANPKALSAVAHALLYLDDKGSSVKLLLESVLLAL